MALYNLKQVVLFGNEGIPEGIDDIQSFFEYLNNLN